MREYIDGAAFREMILCACDALEANKQQINELNVFPVPDGDTGTNMHLTVSTAAAALRAAAPSTSVGKVSDATAYALLRGARGNSGVIVSLLFRGLARGLKDKEAAGAAAFARAMSDGVDAAYKAVMKPTEGTILTVSRVASAAAVDFAKAGTDVELMLVCAIEAAKDALADTINQNPVLKRAGVIDAGGKGYVIILEAMLASLQGRAAASAGASRPPEDGDDDSSPFSRFSTEEITFAYDTVFIVRRTVDKPLDLLRAYLDSIGDSLVIGEDDEAFKVHVHTNIPGAALTEAQKYGTLETAKIENMRTQHDELVGAAPESAAPAPAQKRIGSLAVCTGDGMRDLFLELGVDGVVTGGQTMNPSTEDILREVNRIPAETVFVFPNNKNIIMAAEQCVPLTDKNVVVIPTKTVPQGISAVMMMDPEGDEEELRECFTDAAAAVHTALVTYAARDSEFDGHSIRAGEYLALLDGALLGSYASVPAMISDLETAFRPFDPEFLTIYYGEDVDEASACVVSQALEKDFPDSETKLVRGGQPVYYYMIAAE